MVELKNLTQPLIDAMNDRLFHKVRTYSDPSLLNFNVFILSIPC